MSPKESKKFQSGREVFEKFIPGYLPRQSDLSNAGYPKESHTTPKEIAASIIRPLIEEISKALKNGKQAN